MTLQPQTTRGSILTTTQTTIPLRQHCSRQKNIKINNFNNIPRTNAVRGKGLIITTIIVNLDVNYCQFKDKFCFCSNEMQLCRIWRAKQN